MPVIERILKIGFVLSSPIDNALPSTRISVLNILPYLRATKYQPQILFEPATWCETPDISGLTEKVLSNGIEIVYFQKVHGRSVLDEVEKLSAAGVRTIFGVCDLVDNEMAHAADATVVVTDYLKGLYSSRLQGKIHVVHDGIEWPDVMKNYSASSGEGAGSRHSLRVILVTSSNLYQIPIIDRLPDFVDLTVVGHYPPARSVVGKLQDCYWRSRSMPTYADKLQYAKRLLHPGFKTINWDIQTVQPLMTQADVGIIPVDMRYDPAPGLEISNWQLKSENRLTMKMAVGLPVIASPVPAYKPIVQQGENGFLALTRNDWLECLHALRDGKLRQAMGQRARASVLGVFSQEEQARKLVRVLDQLRDSVAAA